MSRSTTKRRALRRTTTVVERETYYQGEMPHMRAAVAYFTRKYGVAYPWQATQRSDEIMREWCELVATVRSQFDMHGR